MSRTLAELPKGMRVTDHISLGVLGMTFPLEDIQAILNTCGKSSLRERDLPADLMVYYVIALSLYMQVSYGEVLRCLQEGIKWLPSLEKPIRTAGKSGISQARRRLGVEPIRMLHDRTVSPLADPKTPGSRYRHWKVVSLDGSTLDVADTDENESAFGRPKASRGKSGYPKIRFVSLIENGTHVLFGSRMGAYDTQEITLAKDILGNLKKGMLCLADRNFYGYALWKQAADTGADLVWRLKSNTVQHKEQGLPDGSYLSTIYPTEKAQRHKKDGIVVRVVEYRLEGPPDAEPLYRLITTILDPQGAPAEELAALYHERWEIETALDELKTHLRGAKIILRSKSPTLVKQEFYGLMLAHFMIRNLMRQAAKSANLDADQLSFVHAVRIVRRKIPKTSPFSPSAEKNISPMPASGNSRRTGCLQPGAKKQTRRQSQNEQLSRQKTR